MSAFFSSFIGADKVPSSPGGQLGLPLTKDEETSSQLGISETSEFRVEGMTCSACVEVRPPLLIAAVAWGFPAEACVRSR